MPSDEFAGEDEARRAGDSRSNGAGEQQKASRTRGRFPRVSLKKCVEFAAAIHKIGDGMPVRRLRVFDSLGRSADSGPARMLVTTSNSGYGLVKGSYSSERLELTDRGVQIVSNRNDLDRLSAAYDALFANEVFKGFVDRFNQRAVPVDDVGSDFLHLSFGLSKGDAEAAYAVIKENLFDYDLVQELSGRKTVVSREMALEHHGGSGITPDAGGDAETGPAVDSVPLAPVIDASVNPLNGITPMLPSASLVRSPEFHFNIQIHLPSDATPEAYDAIFKSIGTHLLGRGE